VATSAFFASSGPKRSVTHGRASFELPILYFRDDCFGLFFGADFDRVRAALPSDRLHPVRLLDGRAIVAVVAFNYVDTSIGTYGEVGVVVPTVHGASPPPRFLPALRESRDPRFGLTVLHLPVTNMVARDAGRGEWGYTKFVADMDFEVGPEEQVCRVGEEGQHILTLRVPRGGLLMGDRSPIVTFSVKDGDLVRTEIPQRASYRMGLRPSGASLELGDHPVARSIRDLGLSPRPFMSRYFVERAGILPSGSVVERGVRPLDGYRGSDRVGRHTVGYGAPKPQG
jgi:hypothetical protein